MGIPGTSPPSGAEENYFMVDVGAKPDTARRAVATGCFHAKPETLRAVREGRIPKGNALALAEVAGIQAAKGTAGLLPLCHPLPLHAVRIWSRAEDGLIRLWCEASTTGKTGVEMEALTGVSVALLCLYDLVKVIDPELAIGEVRLELKEGGKSGLWRHPAARDQLALPSDEARRRLAGVRACVLTISDRCARGESEDASGEVLRTWLAGHGADVTEAHLVPDEESEICGQIERWLERARPELILSTGGTGLSPRDRTPEALGRLAARLEGREVPGIGELLRTTGANHTPLAWLSRSLGLYLGTSLLVALPGSPKAVAEGLAALEAVLPHLLHMGKGGDHDERHRTR